MWELLLKIATLITWLGGPLYCTDLYKAEWGQLTSFIVFFTPTGVMALAALCFRDETGPLIRWILRSGVVAAAVVLVINGIVAVDLAHGASHPDVELIWTGIALGTPICVAFVVVVLRRLLVARRRSESASALLSD